MGRSIASGCRWSFLNTVAPQDVALWMLDEIDRCQQLTQLDAVLGIAGKFGSEFLYENRNGRTAIDKRVLRAFRNLSDATVVWDRADFCWRKRQLGSSNM